MAEKIIAVPPAVRLYETGVAGNPELAASGAPSRPGLVSPKSFSTCRSL